MSACRILAHTATSCLGRGLTAHDLALRTRRSGLRSNDYTDTELATWIGRVDGLETAPLPAPLSEWECRNNRLAWMALAQDGLLAVLTQLREHIPSERLGIVLGTSTASIEESERAYQHLDAAGRFPASARRPLVHQPHSLTAFVQAALDWRGPMLSISTACSSGAKAYAAGARWLRQGLCDAVLVGGCDSLCGSTLHGFAALQLTSSRPCRPFDADRDGINIGEAAAFAVLVRADAGDPPDSLYLSGYGESSDAHHMSAPHPEGLGARLAMAAALHQAGLTAQAVDYVNLHGTATRLNDEVEANVVADLFPSRALASSTKGWTGHTLGAAGALEAGICLLALHSGWLPGTLNCETPDSACREILLTNNAQRPARVALSNSFGFGGTNASLLFTRAGGAG